MFECGPGVTNAAAEFARKWKLWEIFNMNEHITEYSKLTGIPEMQLGITHWHDRIYLINFGPRPDGGYRWAHIIDGKICAEFIDGYFRTVLPDIPKAREGDCPECKMPFAICKHAYERESA